MLSQEAEKRVIFVNFLLESYNTFHKNSFFLVKIASSTVYRNFFIYKCLLITKLLSISQRSSQKKASAVTTAVRKSII